jgi:hypothetical protein
MITKGPIVPIAFLMLVLASGCGEDRTAPASLRGTVKYKGELVTAGTVTLYSENNGVYNLFIQPDGTYSGTDLPVGEMVVTISSPPPAHSPEEYAQRFPMAEGAKQARSPKGGPEGDVSSASAPQGARVPPRYGRKEKPELTVTLTKGKNTHDFDLE